MIFAYIVKGSSTLGSGVAKKCFCMGFRTELGHKVESQKGRNLKAEFQKIKFQKD